MDEQTKKAVAALEAQLTPRGAFEAVRYGVQTPEGMRFIQTYAQIRELEGTPLNISVPKAA